MAKSDNLSGVPTSADASRIALLYGAAGALWIFSSSWLVSHCVRNEPLKLLLEVSKGWFYVFVTAVVLGLGLNRYFNRIRRSVQLLQENETRFRLMSDNLPDCYVFQSTHEPGSLPRFHYLSAGIERVRGVSAADGLRDPSLLARQIDPAQHSALDAAEAHSIEHLSDFGADFQIRRPDGRVRTLHIQSRPTRTADGKTQWDGFATDITERQKLQEEQRQRTALLQALVSSSPDGIMVLDQQRRRVIQNPRFNELLGIPADIAEQPDPEQQFEYVAGLTADQESFRESRRSLNEHPEQVCQDEIEFKDGRIFERYSGPIIGLGQQNYGRIRVLRDITLRKNQEREIQRFNRLYATLSQINQSIVRCQTRQELFQDACRIVVEYGKCRGAWIGWPEHAGGPLTTAAQFLQDEGPSSTLREWRNHCNVVNEVLGTGCGAVCQRSRTEAPACSCWNALAELGIRSCAAVPLRFQEKTWGVLALCSNESGFFDAEARLLEEIASDISYALEQLQAREQQRLAEKALQESEERFRALYQDAVVGFYRTTPDGRILMVNAALLRMLGYSSFEELNKRNLEQEGFEPHSRSLFKEHIERDGVVISWETAWRRCDGSIVNVSENCRALRDETGRTLYYDGSVEDITARKQVETELRQSLREKTALLQEVHHRVKNNLQVVASLLNLQAIRVKNPAALDSLRETQSRIRSMALLHETLYREGNVARVNAAAYLGHLCAHLSQAFGAGNGRIRLHQRIASVELEIDDAIPCGLMVNELVSNSFKHAFPGERSGQITVELRAMPDTRWLLSVADDGVGLPAGAEAGDAGSLGMKLVHGLAQQINATLEIRSVQGTVTEIVFPARKATTEMNPI